MKRNTDSKSLLLNELKQIAAGLAETFSPFCEVVVHDLRRPKHAICAIYNNLSGRCVGDPVTELGLARIAAEDYPQIIANYANQFPDGRRVKSTSIGIRDSSGQYVAALCLNVDLTLVLGFQSALAQFLRIDLSGAGRESFSPVSADPIRARIDEYAARLASTPRTLKAGDRRSLLQELKQSGCLNVRHSMNVVAAHLGVSRATAYANAKTEES
jgi:predicted transcriptional regulator YheO